MKPAESGKGIITDIKQGFGAKVFPAYALNSEVTDKIRNLCEKWSGTNIGSKL
jgi:hypothetical protein